jgi:hypothetical protein
MACLSAGARQLNNQEQTNLADSELLAISNVLAQAGELGQTNDWPSTNEVAPSNPPPAPAVTVRPPVPTRVQNDDRESRRRNSERQRSERAPEPAFASEAPAVGARTGATSGARSEKRPGRLSYTNFTIIADRNIFDPNRRPRIRGSAIVRSGPIRTTESFALVGTMSYEKGTFAFFDGTSSSYRKALKLSDSIAGYKVMNITPDAVNLAAGTNQVELKVGMQLRREDQGPWFPSAQSTTYAAVTTSSTSSTPASVSSSSSNATAASSGAESDILKRLMQRREQE